MAPSFTIEHAITYANYNYEYFNKLIDPQNLSVCLILFYILFFI